MQYRFRSSSRPEIYRPHFLKHLHNLAVSGFYARGLDADDFALLERVREHGSIVGGHEHRTVLVEELDYWQRHWATEPGVTRQLAPERLKPEPLTEQERLARELERERRAVERELEAQERAREWAIWEREQAKRAKQHTDADREWEEAAPERLRKQPARSELWKRRHYIPEWKWRELAQPWNTPILIDATWKTPRVTEAVKPNNGMAAAGDAPRKSTAIVAAPPLMPIAAPQNDHALAAWKALRREANQSLDFVIAALNDNAGQVNLTKRDILRTLRGNRERLWSLEELMLAIGSDNRNFTVRCCYELAIAGYIYDERPDHSVIKVIGR
jgi:hypothetical protein